MDFSNDLDLIFLDTAVDALVGSETVEVLFDEPGKATDMFSGQTYNTAPSCLIRAAHVAAHEVAPDTMITINGTDYSITEIQPAGTGLFRLSLTTDF